MYDENRDSGYLECPNCHAKVERKHYVGSTSVGVVGCDEKFIPHIEQEYYECEKCKIVFSDGEEL